MASPSKPNPIEPNAELEKLLDNVMALAEAQLAKMTPEERERTLKEIHRISTGIPEASETER
jgi:hypothetical protein